MAHYEKEDLPEGIEVAIPDYANLDRPLVELFTLDPASCAACTYMLAVFEKVRAALAGEADWGDYRYNKVEDIARMARVGVKNLPSIYLNGELLYDSIIPTEEELTEHIRNAK